MPNLSFKELFTLEIEGWCRGLAANQSSIEKSHVFKLLKEIDVAFSAAIENLYTFDIVKISRDFSKASGNLASPKEIAYYILSTLPKEEKLYDEEKLVTKNLRAQVAREFAEKKSEKKSFEKDEFMNSMRTKMFA